MSLNICIFGNSHLAAVKDGVDQHPDRWPELNFTFVGAHQDGLAETTCKNGVLTPLSEEAKADFKRLADCESVDLRHVDAVVIVGAGIAPVRSAMLYHRARWASLPSVQANPAPTADWSLVSKAAFSEMLQAKLANEAACRLVRILQQDMNVPILLISQPRTTTRILDIGPHKLDIVCDAVRTGDAAALSAMFEQTANTLCAELGVTYVPQNANTIAQDMLTKAPYTKGAIRLAKLGRFSQPKEDVLHANAAYGKVVLDQIRAALIRERIMQAP